MAKTDFKELAQKFKPWAKANANKLFIYGMAALVALRAFVFFSESQSTPPEPVSPTPITLPEQLTKESPEWITLTGIIEPLPEFEKSDYFALFQTNIFDPKLVKDERQIDDEANNFTAQAITAKNNNDLPGARRLVDQALALKPRHPGALSLKTELDEKMKPAATPAAGATPSPAAMPAPTPGTPATPAAQ